MYVLGIDPGLSVTGYAVVHQAAGRLHPVAAGALRTSRDRPVAQRLLELHDDLRGLIEEYAPAEMAVEQVFVNRNLQTATSVGRASGVILLAAAGAGIPAYEYTPSAVKMAVCGVGDAEKAQVQAAVAMRLGLEDAPSPADAADALAVALCHLQSSSLRRAVESAR
jgi:crossover junction endodeoxyribonuclease RuvC